MQKTNKKTHTLTKKTGCYTSILTWKANKTIEGDISAKNNHTFRSFKENIHADNYPI